MAILIASTEVISDGRLFKNITGASGKYDDLKASPVQINTVIDFNYPIMTRSLTGDTSFTESNKALGKASILILDRSTYTPTFSGNIEWANDTTPTWSNHQFWHIGLMCWNGTTVRAVASGYG